MKNARYNAVSVVDVWDAVRSGYPCNHACTKEKANKFCKKNLRNILILMP
jgi:hypothetical protein